MFKILGRFKWPLFGIGATAAFVLGIFGHWKQYTDAGQSFSFWEYAYCTLRLFMFDCVLVPENWQLEVARWLAPLIFGYTVFLGIAVLFRDTFRTFSLRFAKDHIVICGLGQKGFALAQNLSKTKNRRVVAIEKDPDNEHARELKDSGMLVLARDATASASLRYAGAMRAGQVIAVVGEDGANVEIAVRLREMVKEDRRVQCYVHIREPALCGLLRSHTIFTVPHDSFDLRIFNNFENTARLLLEKHPPDRKRIAADSQQAVHLVIVGFKRMGESILLQLARIGHFANGRRPLVTILDPDADERWKQFLARYPKIEKLCKCRPVKKEPASLEALARIEEAAEDKGLITTVVVCLPDEEKCLSVAILMDGALKGKDVPILVRMENEKGLATLTKSEELSGPSSGRIRSFGAISTTCTAKMVLEEEQDRLAKVLHLVYLHQSLFGSAKGNKAKQKLWEKLQDLDRKLSSGTELGSKPAQKPWKKLDMFFRDANRQQADHIPVKLRAIGASVCIVKSAPEDKPFDFKEDEVETLARMEHARWCSAYYLAGYDYGNERSDEYKTHPDLVPWEELSKETKDYDREPVRNIPFLFKVVEKIDQSKELKTLSF